LSDGFSSSFSIYLGQFSGINDDGSNNNNSGFGYSSLHDNTSGYFNVAQGYSSLGDNTSGHNNTAIGYVSNSYNQTGSNNTSLGAFAGQGVFGNSVSGCVFIGNEAGKNNSSDNRLYIDNSSTASPLIGGDFSTNQVDINGTIKITGGTPGAGKVLTSDANGLASWITPTTYASSLDDLSDAVSTGGSVFIGPNSGANDDASLNYNVGVGKNCLVSNTSGYGNTAVGYNVLNLNLTGTYNSSLGMDALYLTTGSYNNAFGWRALRSNTTGENNVALGSRALEGCTTGNYNIAIGSQAYFTGNYSNSIAIGYNTSITGSNQVHIGNTSITEIKGQVAFTQYSDGRVKTQIQENVPGLESDFGDFSRGKRNPLKY